MIVVDCNVVAYAWVEGPCTELARRVRAQDQAWKVPPLWRHEMLSVLSLYGRSSKTSLTQLKTIWAAVVQAMMPYEQLPDMQRALELSLHHGITTYDAQYISLAEILNVLCVTEDKALQRAFPSRAVSMHRFLRM